MSVYAEVPKPDTMSYEDVLVKYVLDAYKSRSKYGRPVINYNDTLTVEFAIQLTQIVDLDEQEQVLTLNVWDQYVSILGTHNFHLYGSPSWFLLSGLSSFTDNLLKTRGSPQWGTVDAEIKVPSAEIQSSLRSVSYTHLTLPTTAEV